MSRSLASLHATGKPTVYRLSENCRNYRIVGDSAVRLSGLREPVYDGYMRSGGGLHNYDIFFYHSEREQSEKIAQWLKEFRTQGYRTGDITLLSFRAPQESAAFRLAAAGFRLQPLRQHPADVISYSSVHAFKGLENKVIILTDVVLGEREFQRDLFYTGMTRACETVRVLCDAGSQATLSKWLVEKADR
jgi:hypothetical protein